MAAVLPAFTLTCLILVSALYLCEGFNVTLYQQAVSSIRKNETCHSSSAVSSFCWLCNGTSINRNRYLYRSRCHRVYGPASSVKLLPCPHTRRKNYCYLTCETMGQRSCCPNRYGPLCLKCPEGKLAYRPRYKSVCSGRGSCRSGIKGTGSCSCRFKFRGTACQKCRPGYYGSNCHLSCGCVHGYCTGELTRRCICQSGWSGRVCNEKVLKCTRKDCGENRTCVSPGVCQCKPGYEGVNCTASDLCAPGKNPCGKHATCTQTYSAAEMRLKAVCKCKPGFQGDGTQCILLNPCSSAFRCTSRYEQCLVVGRQMPRCSCIVKYHRVNGTCVKQQCKLPKLCPPNSVCNYDSSYPNSQVCQCKSGYYGKSCVPTIVKVSQTVSNIPEYRQSTYLMRMIANALQRTSVIKPITVLLPLSKRSRPVALVRTTIMSRHVVLAPIYRTNGTYYTAYGEKIVFEFAAQDSNKSTTAAGSVTVNNITIQIKLAYRFIGGMIYVIEKEIANPKDRFAVGRGLSDFQYLEKVSKPMSQLYKEFFLKKTYRRMTKRVVIFPIKEFTKHEYEYLMSSDSVAAFKRKHFIEMMTMYTSSNFSPVTLYMRGLSIIGMRSWRLTVVSNGQSFLGGSKVIANGILIDKTVIIIVEKQLDSSLPIPILPGQCNLKQTHVIKLPWPKSCPTGTYKINRNRWSKIVMCQKDTFLKMQCCPGFYSPTCAFHCPGPYGSPCHNNGKCFDGRKGTGKCYCKPSFDGLECEKCTSPELYGPKCNKTCPCVNGICDSGTIFSTGRCLRCNRGFTGPKCERKIIYCYNSTTRCGEHEHCERNQAMQAVCKCDDGYHKNGSRTCVVYNPCLDPVIGYGRCHSQAVCKYLGPGNSTCVCRKGWYGDGVACEKEWGECKTTPDCKVEGSVCIRGACQCKNGRSYADRECLKKFNCKVKNGGCHPYAICLSGARDYNSHCKCRQNVSGDGFICLVSWIHAPQMQEMDTSHPSYFYITMLQSAIRMRQKKLGSKKPLTIIYAKSQDQFLNMRNSQRLIFDGLYFIPQKGATYQITDFFYPKANPRKFIVSKKGNDTFIGSSKVLYSNIYVKEGLLHIVNTTLDVTPASSSIYENRTKTGTLPPSTSTAAPTTTPLPPGQIAYIVFDKRYCPDSRRFAFPGSSHIAIYPSFGIPNQRKKKLYLCTPESRDMWPPGTYCTVEVRPKRQCPIIANGIRLKRATINRMTRGVIRKYFPNRFHGYRSYVKYELCCGFFGRATSKKWSSKSNIQKVKKSMPTFSLINSGPCPRFPGGYTLSEDRLVFRPIALHAVRGQQLFRSCYSTLCFYLCHYTDHSVFSFALPKPVSGCERGFKSGFRVQHLEKNDTKMPVRSLHLAGYFKHNHNVIRLEFCVIVGKDYIFQKGSYCIYRKMGQCPAGFNSSWAHIDDEDDPGSDGNFGGVVPDGVYSTDTRYYFCCRNDGPVNSAITFPFRKPFYLFRSPFTKTCQKVRNYRVRSEIVHLDAEDARKLGKPAVEINGSVPMSRSTSRGSDVDVHYCFYDNRPRSRIISSMGLIRFGGLCPPKSKPVTLKDTGTNFSTSGLQLCTFEERTSKNIWPIGDYCLTKTVNQRCFENFYKMAVNLDVQYNVSLNPTARIEVCCRDNIMRVTKPLEMPLFDGYSFGLIADSCPTVVNKTFVMKAVFGRGVYICYYSPIWPTSIDFALPKVAATCLPSFKPTTIGQEFLGNSQLWDIFQDYKGDPLSNVTSLDICVRKAGDGKISWPAGEYCILSSDRNVMKEFPIAITFSRSVRKKEVLTSTFLFCRSDGNSTSTRGLPPLTYLAVLTLKNCPTDKKTVKKLPLGGFGEKSSSSIERQSFRWTQSALADFSDLPGKLWVCLSETNNISYTKTKVNDGKCKCASQFASCKDGVCRCNNGYFGDGQVCQPCACDRSGTCQRGMSFLSRRCQCAFGFWGNGIYCSADPYAQAVVNPDFDVSVWPGGRFSFLKTVDDVSCPDGFDEEESRLIGRNEGINYAVTSKSILCSKKKSVGNVRWPEGNYCVWTTPQGLCPSDLKLREMYLPFNYVPNSASDKFIKREGGKDGKQMRYTANFCCKSSSSDSSKIIFPAMKLFSFIRRGKRCPQIEQMSLTQERLYLARGIDEVYVDGEHGQTASGSLTKDKWLGPDFEMNHDKKFLALYLCNYFLNPHEVYPRSCNKTNQAFCRPHQKLFTVIGDVPVLAPLKKYLKRCSYLEKIKNMHHLSLSLFVDSSMVQEGGSNLDDLDCDFMKDNMIFSKQPLSLLLPRLTTSGMHFPTLNGATMFVRKNDNQTNIFVFGNSVFDTEPLVFANNGMIFLLKQSNIARFRGTSKSSKTPYIVGAILTILIVAAAAGFAFWYFKRRHIPSSVSSFTNPVYYRRVENAQ